MTTPEQLAHDAGVAMGNALADALEAPILKLADAIAQTRAEQAELRDEVHALANRVEGLQQYVSKQLVKDHGFEVIE